MRTNLPVTATEFTFAERDTLVSVTDTKGRITYCNPAFVHVSGFAHEELLGQPHNLIRHPDMPPEAFRDLWDTIARGLPWTGLVKNRRKNGDFYWVQANVTPLRDGAQVTGYLSVRTLPTRAQVQAAETLYNAMRAEAEAGRVIHVLRHGTVLRQDLRGRIARLLMPSTPTPRLMLTQALTVALVLLPGAASPWWRRKCARWPHAPRRRHATSSNSSPNQPSAWPLAPVRRAKRANAWPMRWPPCNA